MHKSIFVYNIVQKLAVIDGNNLEVISPVPWWHFKEEKLTEPGIKIYGKEKAYVHMPRYLDFPNKINIRNLSMGRLNSTSFKIAALGTLKNLKFKPDIVYSHFLFRGGPTAIKIANHFRVPSVVALGESTLEKYNKIYGLNLMQKTISRFSRIISVSEVNKSYCVNKLNINKDKIKVIPNAVDTNLFYPRNKMDMRKKYGLPTDKNIIIFIGHFIERKGPLRVVEALKKLPKHYGAIFIGTGPQEPIEDRIYFKGSAPHKNIPELLSAADIFVLPTLNEGSCNVINEALACGLSVVSSDIAALKEQVKTLHDVLLVDPYNINEISDAIKHLLSNKNKTTGNSYDCIYDIDNRAKDIFDYLSYIDND